MTIVDSIVLGQAAGVEHVSFYSRTEHLIFPYNEPGTQRSVNIGCHKRRTEFCFSHDSLLKFSSGEFRVDRFQLLSNGIRIETAKC